MKIKSDIEIAQSKKLKKIERIAKKAGIPENSIECYGKYKAKIDVSFANDLKRKAKLVLVTAITPTPAGEGKTTTTIGLCDALNRMNKNAVVALREPSLGPVFGVKGGAAGGGYAQVVPMEDINLHFTGDIHAVGAANNLLAAMLDNHIFRGNKLNIDTQNITWKRCVDMNDRQLRFITDGLGGEKNGVPRSDGFEITVASEIMAVLCLSENISQLKSNLAAIVVGYDKSGNPVTCGDLKAQGAMTALLKDAIKPNLVQTLEGSPAIVHGGPFANIAHGCNSIIATDLAMKVSDYAITEAGFGADLGAEKFFDIKCRKGKFKPSACVVVATVRALKMHGGLKKDELGQENLEALKRGIPNLLRHVKNITKVYKLPCVVAVNAFPSDTKAEHNLLISECEKLGIKAVLSDVYAKGGRGGIALAEEVVRLCESNLKNEFDFCYPLDLGLKEKIESVVKKVYGGSGVEFSENAIKQMQALQKFGYSSLPVCIAKTQYSFSDNPLLLCAPEDFKVSVKGLKVSAGAGFVVVYTGDVLTMPGLPERPAAELIDVSSDGIISGLF